MLFNSKNKGFTLIEMMVALAIITVLSLTILGSLGPWMAFKQKLDNQNKLQDLKQGLSSIYSDNAMVVDTTAGRTFLAFTGTGSCNSQEAAFTQFASSFTNSPQNMAKDGYANPWCIYISNPLTAVVEGTPITYRTIAIVSRGANSELDSTAASDGTITSFDPATGRLTLGSDDDGIVISGLPIQKAKLQETLTRMTRLATMYETYFTTRFLATPGRDITKYYFSQRSDASGTVPSTEGVFQPATVVLNSLGASPSESVSAWEAPSNIIEVGNYNETQGGITVKSPYSAGVGQLPYTALLRARVPSVGVPSYLTKIVIGNY